MNIVLLGIGTNLGNRKANLKEAVARIGEYIGPVLKASSVYETESWGFKADNEFLNMAVKVETKLEPSGLLGKVLFIESLLGRKRHGNHYTSRVIDIDILLFDGVVLNENGLEIPHPRMHERMFVLVPLCEIAAEVMHPVLKKSIYSLLGFCTDKSKVVEYRK